MTESPLQSPYSESGVDEAIQLPARVILFNDEVHTFEEVITQIIKATGVDVARAEALTWEVHHHGKAMVYEGEMTRCVQVSHVLEEIDLLTQIEM
jgi:ATP-dependent Clp protease adapter protein ClpS